MIQNLAENKNLTLQDNEVKITQRLYNKNLLDLSFSIQLLFLSISFPVPPFLRVLFLQFVLLGHYSMEIK